MCTHGEEELVNVLIPAGPSATDRARWRLVGIDRCIAPIVSALSEAGIHMRSSCCGHNSGEGDIYLQDGRALIVLSKEYADRYYRDKTRVLDILKTWPGKKRQALVEESKGEAARLIDKWKKLSVSSGGYPVPFKDVQPIIVEAMQLYLKREAAREDGDDGV